MEVRSLKNKDIIQYLDHQYNKEDNLKAILSQIRKEENRRINKWIKMAAMFMLVIGITAGVGYCRKHSLSKSFSTT